MSTGPQHPVGGVGHGAAETGHVTRSKELEMTVGSVFDLIRLDHRLIDELAKEFTHHDVLKKKQETMYWIVRELSRHANTEETCLYPHYEKYVENGKYLVDRCLQEHLQVKQELDLLDNLSLTPDNVTATSHHLHRILHDFHQHAQHEEQELLPQLEAKLSAEEKHELMISWNEAKAHAVTHPHPELTQKFPDVIALSNAELELDRAKDEDRFGMDKSELDLKIKEKELRLTQTIHGH